MKKVILVPSDIGQQFKPVDETLGDLDADMMKILQAREEPADVKLAKYNQVLQRHRTLMTSRNKPYEIEIHENDPTIKESDVLGGIPDTKRPAAKLLLDFVNKQRGIEIANNGEVTINGNHIRNSNIVDLIHDLSRDRRTHTAPVGMNVLLEVLKQANIPLEYIGNKNRLSFFAIPQSPAYHTPVARRFERMPPGWVEQ